MNNKVELLRTLLNDLGLYEWFLNNEPPERVAWSHWVHLNIDTIEGALKERSIIWSAAEFSVICSLLKRENASLH